MDRQAASHNYALFLYKDYIMLLRQICDVKDNEIVIHLPDSFTNNKKVLVTVDDSILSKADKLALLKLAASDPLFQSDVKEVSDDFGAIDNEAI